MNKPKKKKSNHETNLIVHEHSGSATSESFRALRTGIQYSSLDKPIKTLVATSAIPGEGKTTVLSNLGIVMAQAGKKVLLVESDLRKSDLHCLFKLESSAGLTNLLLDEYSAEELIQPSFIPNLYLLVSGPTPPDCSALLGSEKMKDLLESLKEKFELILLDSPPLGGFTDAVVLALQCDAVFLVVGSGDAPRNLVIQAKKRLEDAKAKIIGVVLNKVDIHRTDGYYGYYYYSYYYSQEKTRKKEKRQRT